MNWTLSRHISAIAQRQQSSQEEDVNWEDFIAGAVAGWALNMLVVVPIIMTLAKRVDG